MQILKEVKIFLTTKFWTKVLIISVFELKILLYSQVSAHFKYLLMERLLGKKIIRLLPPLVTSEDDLMDGLNKIIRVLK